MDRVQAGVQASVGCLVSAQPPSADEIRDGGTVKTDVDPILSLSAISKTFAGQRVLTDAAVDLFSGEIHALLGHNGSGKSTLIKCLAGVYTADQGAAARFCGDEVDFYDPHHGWRDNLRFIHQDLGLVPSLSAAENLALSRGFSTTRTGRIDWREENRLADEAFRRFGLHIDPRRPVGTLPASTRAIVAIARAFQGIEEPSRAVVVLDEPTATLPQREVDLLFDAVRGIAARGAAVLLVSHRMNDVMALADRVTILRDGHLVTSLTPGSVTRTELVNLIVGRELESVHLDDVVPGATVLAKVTELSGDIVDDLSFTLHESEVLGIAGLDGSGRTEVTRLMFGASPRRGGSLVIDGVDATPSSPLDAMRHGVALVPGDRAKEGLLASFSVKENLTLPDLGPVSRAGTIIGRRERADVQDWIKRIDLRPPDPVLKVSLLSGGNAQKVVVARALRQRPRILLLEEPTAGVDIGAKSQIYTLLASAAAEGTGVIVVSSDSEELVRICDRVLVLVDGHLTEELSGQRLSEEQIHHATHRESGQAHD